MPPASLFLLSPGLAVLFDMDVIVRLEGMNGIIWKFDTAHGSDLQNDKRCLLTYVKPLIRVNSCLIVPPCSLALCFALGIGK